MTHKKRTPVWSDSQEPLREWYASALGQSIFEQMGLQLDHILPGIFGYQGLQVGSLRPGHSLLGKAGIHRSIVLDSPPISAVAQDTERTAGESCDSDTYRPDIGADVLSLPIANDVMKLVMLPHTLDFCHLPHQALREADRVLTSDGQLVIVGFNPWSQFGLGRTLLRWRRQVPWSGQFYSRGRVTDWLSVLNYRVMYTSAFYLRPPLQSVALLDRLRRVEKGQPWVGGVGGVYVIHAKKQSMPMTLSRRHWLRQRSRIAVGSFARVQEAQARGQSSSHREQSDD